MPFNYDKLWKLLLERKITKEELRNKIQASPNTLVKMGKNESVSLAVIDRICNVLDVLPEDVIEYRPLVGYKVGDIFYHHQLLSKEQYQNELASSQRLISEAIKILGDKEADEKFIAQTSMDLIHNKRNIIIGVYNSKIYFSEVFNLPVDCLMNTDNKLDNDNTTIIISQNDAWCEQIDVRAWETANNSDVIKKNIDIITTAPPEVIELINREFKKLINQLY